MPVRTMSFREIFCSMTISAPVFTLPISNEARTNSLTVCSVNEEADPLSPISPFKKESIFRFPSCSSAERSSGWKMMISAVTAMVVI